MFDVSGGIRGHRCGCDIRHAVTLAEPPLTLNLRQFLGIPTRGDLRAAVVVPGENQVQVKLPATPGAGYDAAWRGMKFAFRTAPSAPPHPGAFGFRQRGGQQGAWLRPKHGCGLLPVTIVFVLSSDEGVRDFMQDHVALGVLGKDFK